MASNMQVRVSMRDGKGTLTRYRIVVVGNGMVAFRFYKQLKSRDVSGYYELVVIGEEAYNAYDRVRLSSTIKSDSIDDILLGDEEWLRGSGITFYTNCRVQSVDSRRKVIYTSSGDTLNYDSLVLATGSKAYIPNIPGVELNGVYSYRTIDDLKSIKNHCSGKSTGVVVGGGLLGLEAAKILQDLGLKAHIVQNSDSLMNRQLQELGGEVLRRNIDSLGIDVHLKKYSTSIEFDDYRKLKINFEDGYSLQSDIVIFATGIVPLDNIRFDEEMKRGVRGGFVINDFLQTNIQDVYAIGECALHKGKTYGLVTPGYEMADVLVDRFLGDEKSYHGSELSCRLKVLGVDVVSIGDYLGDGDVITYKTDDTYRMLLLRSGMLVGCSSVGSWDAVENIQQAIHDQKRISKRMVSHFIRTGEIELYEEDGGVLSWRQDAIICNCNRVTKGEIVSTIEGGATDLKSVMDATSAGSSCGSCQNMISRILGESDDPDLFEKEEKSRFLWIMALLSIVATLCFYFVPGIVEVDSVQSFVYKLTQIWTVKLYKQITGFTLLGLSILALAMSLRKRLKPLRFLNFGFWRNAHSLSGVLSLFILFFHTGFHLGSNANFLLMLSFVSLNLLGGLSALFVANESQWIDSRSRYYRYILTRAHIIFFWPYPVLVAYHIFKVYYY